MRRSLGLAGLASYGDLGSIGLERRKLKTERPRRIVESVVGLPVERAALDIQDFVKPNSSYERCTGCNNLCRVQDCGGGSRRYNPGPAIAKDGGG